MKNKAYEKNRECILNNAKKYYQKNKKKQIAACTLRQKAKYILAKRHREEYLQIYEELKKLKK